MTWTHLSCQRLAPACGEPPPCRDTRAALEAAECAGREETAGSSDRVKRQVSSSLREEALPGAALQHGGYFCCYCFQPPGEDRIVLGPEVPGQGGQHPHPGGGRWRQGE